jgi:hypothetical protein
MFVLHDLIKTCNSCPSQWTAETPERREVFIRYRYGYLRVDLDGETVYAEQHGDGLDGTMDTERMLKLTGMTLCP